jgi:periplasmic protein TonB
MSNLDLLTHLGPMFMIFFVVQLVVAFLCFATMVGLRFVRRGAARFWMGPAVVALALLPGVIAVGLSALALRQVFRAMALTGSGGVAALAAGSAESFIPLVFGLACVGGLSALGLLLLGAGTSKVDEGAAEGRFGVGTLGALLNVLLAFGLVVLLAVLVGRVNTAAPDSGQITLWWRATAFGAAFVTLRLFASAAATAFRAPRGRAPLVAKVVPIVSLLLAMAGSMVAAGYVWARTNTLVSVAMTGVPGGLEGQTVPPPAPSPTDEPTPSAEEPAAPEPETIPEETEAPATPPPTPASARPRPTARATPPPTEGVPGGVVGSVLGGIEEQPPSGPVRVGGAIREPKRLKLVQPRYPDIAKQARVQGVVILECTIDTRGRVTDVKVLRGIPLLDAAAIEAVEQWVYEPTLLNGVPVPVIMTVTVNFKLS